MLSKLFFGGFMKKKWLLLFLMAAFLFTACEKREKVETKVENRSEMHSTEAATKKIGIIQLADHIALDRSREGFMNELKKEGVKADFIVENAQGELAQIPTIVSKLKGDKVDLIYAIATPAAQGAKNGVKDIPIVFSAVTNPLDANLVKNNEHPGENVTGVSDYYSAQAQLESFLEIFPKVKKIGVLYSTNEANSLFQIKELKEIATHFGLELNIKAVNNVNDVSTAMAALTPHIDAFVCITDNLVAASSKVIAQQLKEAKIPSLAYEAGPVENGMLMSEGVDFETLGQEAGKMAKEILAGKNPGDIPVFYPQQSFRVVNETTAFDLGLREDNAIFHKAEKVK